MGLKNLLNFKNNTSKKLSKNEMLDNVRLGPIPNHIAIIMDGNGRWAKKRGLPRVAGHRQGVEAIRDIVKICSEIGIKHLTLFAFSTENWKRPKFEIEALMALLVEYLKGEVNELNSNNVRINAIGDFDRLPDAAYNQVIEAEEITKNNTGLQINLALNYGGRADILRAVKNIVQDICDENLSLDDINEITFSKYLYTKDIPDPDLLIRTSGEYRISNFLLYQIAYTELWFSSVDIMWPDFKPVNLLNAIIDYQHRNRRYGGI